VREGNVRHTHARHSILVLRQSKNCALKDAVFVQLVYLPCVRVSLSERENTKSFDCFVRTGRNTKCARELELQGVYVCKREIQFVCVREREFQVVYVREERKRDCRAKQAGARSDGTAVTRPTADVGGNTPLHRGPP
jgi:hypothetical protein